MSDVALFSYRSPELPPGGNLSGRLQLFEKLRDFGLQPVVSLGAEGAYQGEEVVVHGLVDEDTTEHLGSVALEQMGVIVNRLGRSIQRVNLARPDLLPPMINENLTRSLAFRKHRANDQVLEPLGIAMPTRLTTSM